MNFLVIIAFTLCVLGLYTILYYLQRWKMGIPGPLGLPLFGNFFQLKERSQNDIYDFYLELSLQYGKVFLLRAIAIPDLIITSNPDDIKYILETNFHNYVKGPTFKEIFRPLFGDGIFNADGSLWESQRKIASHMFKIKQLKEMVPVFIKHGQKVVEYFEKITETENNNVDIEEVFARFTLDSIGEIAFGYNIGSLEKDIPFSKAFNQAQLSTEMRFYQPWWKWLNTNSEILLKQSVTVIDEFVFKLIEERSKENEATLILKNDLLSRYLLLHHSGKENFSRKYLRDIIINFMIAGRDTTSQTLTWLIYLLAQNPMCLKNLVSEIQTTLTQDSAPTYDQLTKGFPYLEGCINETLRLFPPVPYETKTSIKADILPSGYRVPPNCCVDYLPWILGRHPELWDSSKEFLPERWIRIRNEDNKKIKKHSPPFIPFNYGRRTCLGKQMAYIEIKTMVCLLLRKFSFQQVQRHKVEYKAKITLSTKHGMEMAVHKLQ